MLNNFFRLIAGYKYLLLVLFLFGLLYSSISIVNHYLFRTSAHDLGIYMNALFDYNHFQKNTSTIFTVPLFVNSQNDHFELLPILWAPFYYIFGSYTLVIIQILSILFGSIGVYKLIHVKTNNNILSLLASIHFLSIWGIYSALAFDYHNNVIAAMFVPWLLYYFDMEKWLNFFVFLLLILVSKENMALWAFFIGIGLFFMYRRETSKMKIGILCAIISALYFIIIMKVIMPAMGDVNSKYNHFHFQALGKTMTEAVLKLIQHPIDSFVLLFENHTHNKDAYGIKTELHLMVLISGGWALFFRPQYLLMLIPIFAQKLYNDDYTKWGINYHYSIEFVPILTIALFDVIASMYDKTVIKDLKIIKITSSIQYVKKLPIVVAIISCVLTFGATISKIDHRTSKWYNSEKQRFYDKRHYSVNFNAAEVHEALKLIPQNAIVSAQTNLAPQLAFRDTIYLFPVVNDAQYIALLVNGSTYPVSKEKYTEAVHQYSHNEKWEIIYSKNNTIILHKKSEIE